MASSTLGQTQRYAAGALLALALRQAQTHQTVLLGSHSLDEEPHPDEATAVEPDARNLWTHESRGLLRPVLRFLEIDPKAWAGVEKTAASSDPKHHIGAFLRKIFEDEDDDEKARSERSDQELALAKAVDAMAMGLECGIIESAAEALKSASCSSDDDDSASSARGKDYRKMAVLYMLLSACVADVNMAEEGMGSPRVTKGYDARHRVALRLLATWLDVKWGKMEAVEIMVACSAMAAAKEEEQSRESSSPRSRWENWKRGGIIGAAALTGGTLMAISGGLAAPAIAAGFTALVPALHTLVPIIGASGFAAIATAAGHTAGSVAVAASFGGGSLNRLAVGIGISGFAFTEEDYSKPWEGWKTNLERYVLQWESKHVFAISTAIQDWLASRVALELMREGAMQTVLSGIISAFAWPATLVSAADFIDSKWTVAIDRSDKAGKMLADVLLNGLQGSRWTEGIVERVVLIGAPVSVQGEMWESARKMVAGRFVNVYSTNDWILGITFRASLLTQGLAGIQAVEVPGVENVDVTELVFGHSSYRSLLQEILGHLELNSYFPVFHPCTPREK
ncbi:transmembrane and coiled-coil domain-containing protein 4-like [Panicum miliaceum]|uniref:Transmembrane and coiled-coil domain-containing protein 4-like n=1 Tax=Panicum miliaceum TaxID=4540 RepID=A0A3L6SBQ5_PANMI|nr:transmembrane and coiled-coil domain-containing protein 4-like [Panicum miliaceum]